MYCTGALSGYIVMCKQDVLYNSDLELCLELCCVVVENKSRIGIKGIIAHLLMLGSVGEKTENPVKCFHGVCGISFVGVLDWINMWLYVEM